MYKVISWSQDLDLSEFYAQATARGFVNNSSQKSMIDCFRNEERWNAWILYYNNKAVGSVAAHTIDNIGYRICARTCVLSDLLPINTLRTRNQIATHQHVTAQYLIPACMSWASEPMYITSHPSEVGTQKLVHNIWAPTLEKTGVLTKEFETQYRGHMQTFWKLNTAVFLEQLEKVKWTQ